MPTTPRGVWTPNDGDDFDIITDLAAMGVSIDDAIGVVAGTVQYRAGTTANRPAVGAVTKGFLYFATDTNVLWRHSGSAWELFGFGPFKSSAVFTNSAGTVTSVGSMGALTGLSLATTITTAAPCRAKITLSAQGWGQVSGVSFSIGVAATGATTYTPTAGNYDTVMFSAESTAQVQRTQGNSWYINLNAGTTTLNVLGQVQGSTGVRSIRNIGLIVEPVSE